MTATVYFTPTPIACDFCRKPFPEVAGTKGYDFAAIGASPMLSCWGFGCEDCYKQRRKYPTLGLGMGQSYARKTDGRFWMVEGFPAEPEPARR